ncbi:protein belonging to Uncharacterized protein family UPF0165 [Candidatus Magnetobacterium bavaricum]|uniref:Protein belonging to Uncharacterized protein family UPF0165 n=1 Tax=Candidatus Magnetobacterium bavaricum TaxID=29290 RepID=A0A0F3GNJ4_9BACT|nr:protein belonging to Uncharacterized protein family UPF0165 [Candidatus Magnetobacterium bavaricum]
MASDSEGLRQEVTMPTTIKAIFAHGVFEPLDDIELQEGMEVNITIEKIEGSHAYFRTKEWQERVRGADEALANGEYVEFDSAEAEKSLACAQV